jgi:DNA-binding response OmpR family regulator
MRILVVDDKPQIIDEVCDFLKRSGHDGLAAEGVDGAV